MHNDTGKSENNYGGKYLTVTYRGESAVDMQTAGITVFDLWALSVYLRAEAYNIVADDDAEGTEKGITVLYGENDMLTVLKNSVSVLDLWALSNYLKMRGDEQYITVQTAQRMKEAANGKQIDVVHGMPGPSGMKRVS